MKQVNKLWQNKKEKIKKDLAFNYAWSLKGRESMNQILHPQIIKNKYNKYHWTRDFQLQLGIFQISIMQVLDNWCHEYIVFVYFLS